MSARRSRASGLWVVLFGFAAQAGAQGPVPEADWADARRKEAIEAVPSYAAYETAARELLDAGWNPYFAFPDVAIDGGRVRRFDWVSRAWQDSSVEAFLSGNPQWRTLVALSALNEPGQPELVPRPWSNILCAPGGRRCLVAVTTGGFDEIRWMEVDLETGARLVGGFDLPPSRGSVAWLDDDTLLLTAGLPSSSGYPLELKVWKRGHPVGTARTIFTAPPGSDALFIGGEGEAGRRIGVAVATRGTSPAGLIIIGPDARASEARLPVGAPQGVVQGQLALALTADWVHAQTLYPAGTLLSFDIAALAAGRLPAPEVVFRPGAGEAVASGNTSRAVLATREAFYVAVLREGGQVILRAARGPRGWRTAEVLGALGKVARPLSSDALGEAALASLEAPSAAPALYRLDGREAREVRRAKSLFAAEGLAVSRGFATADDGTAIPFWLVRRADASGPGPTIIHAYGSSNVPLLPTYRAEFGRLWLERGGNYVIAQVRGGGEYGPSWHAAGEGVHGGRAVEDLLAIARKVIEDGVTSPEQLGLYGMSAGGGLVTSAATISPALFAGVVSHDGAVDPEAAPQLAGSPVRQAQLALLAERAGQDMADRYWPARAFNAARGCPNLLLTSWRGDQRVPAEESRALAARHHRAGCPTLLFEQPGGDHGTTSATLLGITFGFFADRLGLPSGPHRQAPDDDEERRH